MLMRKLGGTTEMYPAITIANDALPDAADENEIECRTLSPIGAQAIPPRQWAYGRFLLLGSAAVIGAVDGGGKGAIAVVIALAMITGRPLLGERVWRTGPVAIVAYEDDDEEWHRRIAAACLHYEIDYDAVIGQIHFLRPAAGYRICFGTYVDRNLQFPHGDQIIERLRNIGAVLLIIDPFNQCHDLEDGNNNAVVAKVAAEIARIAHETNSAVLVLHHLRKGATGNPDDLMGATSLRATFRSCRILSRMTPEQAKQMSITDPWRYIRITGSKEKLCSASGEVDMVQADQRAS
jgi:RecA-family ATPase